MAEKNMLLQNSETYRFIQRVDDQTNILWISLLPQILLKRFIQYFKDMFLIKEVIHKKSYSL